MTLVALLALTTGAWADEVKYPIVYDFEAAANAGENPANKNGSTANGQQFYGWESEDGKDKARQDYKGYEYAEGSKLPEVCHVWRRSDRFPDNVAGKGGLYCPSNKQMAVDGLTEGLTVTIIYDATNATSKEIVWAIGDGSSAGGPGSPRAKAIINGAEAVPGTTTIKSGDVITVTEVTPAANGSGYIVFAVKKDMVIKKIIIDVAPAGTPVNLIRGTGDKANEWTIEGGMPAGNVTVEPEYYAQAMFATEGNEALTPTAAEDAIAGTDAPLIVEGTVAKAGQTDDAQGQVMYAVTTTADAAPALTAFSATVPTAEDYDDATTVFVWYYIQGADAPTGTVPSDDNTFSDSDISGTPLQVNVLPNKFTLTFDPAPVEKVDVTVDGQTATPAQDGKLENVPMGKQVKVTAKTGYKLKKVEVKKGSAAAKTITIGDMELTYADGDNWQTIVSKNSDKIKIFSNKIVQLAQPAPNQYRYIHVWYTEVKPSDFIEPSNNYQWDIVEVYF